MKMQTLQPVIAALVLFFSICACNSSLKRANETADDRPLLKEANGRVNPAAIYSTVSELPDSLLQKWKFKNNESDTLIAKKILSLAENEIDRRNFRQAFLLTRLAGDVLDNYGDSTQISMALVYLNLGLCYNEFEESEKAVINLDMAYETMMKHGDTLGIEASRIYFGKGVSLFGVCEQEKGMNQLRVLIS